MCIYRPLHEWSGRDVECEVEIPSMDEWKKRGNLEIVRVRASSKLLTVP